MQHPLVASRASTHSVVKRAIRGSLRENLLRGVPLHVTMRHFGSVWRVAPDKLSDVSRAQLWELSEPCTAVHRFLSHTWHTSGLQKYLCLLVANTYHRAIVATLFCSLCLCVLDYLGYLPRTRQVDRKIGTWEGTLELPALQTKVVPLCVLTVMLGTVGMPPFRGNSMMCFLDVVCVNQYDLALQQEAVYSFSGFLKKSNEMYTLWSPPYFRRLWCVFEVAAFRALNKTGKLTWAAAYVEMTVLLWFLTISVIQILNTSFVERELPPISKYLPLASIALVMLPAHVVLTHALRGVMWEKKDMERQLRLFDVRQASCDSDTDRDFIFECIKEWYGGADEFNEHVRGDLRSEVLGAVRETTMPLGYMCLLVLPTAAMHCEVLVGLLRVKVPAVEVLSYSIAVFSVDAFVLPFGVNVLVYAVERFAEPCKSPILNAVLSIFLHVSVFGPVLVLAHLCSAAYAIHIGASIAYSGICSSLLWLCVSFRSVHNPRGEGMSTNVGG